MRKLKLQIESYMAKWVPIVGIQHWDISVKYYIDKTATTFAAAISLPQYNELELEYNLGKIPDLTDIQIEKLVLHELCHAPIALLSNNLTGHRDEKMISYLDEQATTNFAQALWRATGRK